MGVGAGAAVARGADKRLAGDGGGAVGGSGGAIFFSGFASFFLGAVSGVPSHSAKAAYIDVTVANAECRFHHNKSFDKLFAEKDAAKHKAYKEAAAADGYTPHTFFIDTFCKMDSKSLELLKMLWAITRDDPPSGA